MARVTGPGAHVNLYAPNPKQKTLRVPVQVGSGHVGEQGLSCHSSWLGGPRDTLGGKMQRRGGGVCEIVCVRECVGLCWRAMDWLVGRGLVGKHPKMLMGLNLLNQCCRTRSSWNQGCSGCCSLTT